MSRNGSGTYNLPVGNPVVTGTTISSTTHNSTMSDVAAEITNSIAADGQTTPTANLPMGGYKHTNVADASARTDYGKVSQIQDGGYMMLASVSGADTITATISPAITAYALGQFFTFVSAGANTGAVTLNINTIGAKAVTKEGTTALAAGDIASGAVVNVVYDGTQFQLVSGRSVQPLDAQLTTLAGITAQQATDLAAVSTFMGTVLDDADAATMRSTTGTEPTLIAESTVSGAAVTSVQFTGLDINTHKSYRVEIDLYNPTVSTSTYSIFFNNDLVDTNYYRQYIYANGASITAARSNDAIILTLTASTNGSAEGPVSLDVGGRPRVTMNESRYNSTTTELVTKTIVKTGTVANVTQIDIVGSVASSIGIGTKIRIYRGDK